MSVVSIRMGGGCSYGVDVDEFGCACQKILATEEAERKGLIAPTVEPPGWVIGKGGTRRRGRLFDGQGLGVMDARLTRSAGSGEQEQSFCDSFALEITRKCSKLALCVRQRPEQVILWIMW
ncbi:unnamed protein product [Ostreobium quekettii]|uniref:Uncharacterized protein n=1 Tax=Ostreobium quekettii TaxID=121088 RepID=A0A8S1IS84_9CHLO|nr:unnamed protein product [Ostreobium quekettii]